MTFKFEETPAEAAPNSKKPSDVSDIIGSFGLWQKTVWIAVMYFEFMGAVANLSSPMLIPEVPFKCDLNFTKNSFLAKEKGPMFFLDEESKCDVRIWNKGAIVTVPCQKWIYDHKAYKYTYTEEWNLVCNDAWLLSFSNTVTILGDLMACSIFGYMSDRFGRRRTLMMLVFPVLIGTLVTLFASNIQMYLIGRFLLGAAGHGGLVVSFVLLMEVVGAKFRALVGMTVKLGFTVGGVFTGVVAYSLRNSFQIQTVFTVACILLIPIACMLPESPRWLLVSTQEDGNAKAKEVIRKAAKWNKIEVAELDEKVKILSRKMLQEGPVVKRQYGFSDLVKTTNMRRKTLIVTFLWGIGSFCYYGITLMSTRLGADPLISFILILLVELPAYAIINPLAHFKGYKVGMTCGFLLNFIVFVTSSEAKIETGWSVVLVILLAKVGSILASSCVCNYATEMFPTVVRSLGLGTCAIVSRIFALLSPFLKELAEATSMSAVFGLLAALSLACSTCVLFLPDTYRKPFPETLEDSEQIGLESC